MGLGLWPYWLCDSKVIWLPSRAYSCAYAPPSRGGVFPEAGDIINIVCKLHTMFIGRNIYS